MAYIRSKKIRNKTYYYLVEGKNVGGKVKQKVLAYIGDKEKLEKLHKKIEDILKDGKNKKDNKCR